MLYKTIKIGEKEFKARISCSGVVSAEEKLGKSLYQVLTDIEQKSNIIEATAIFLHEALQQFHHGTDMETVYSLLDEYVDTGATAEDMVTDIVMPILEVSGFLKKPVPEESQEAPKPPRSRQPK